MHDLHGGVGGIDPLSSGSASATDFDAEILRAEFDVNFFRLGKYGDGSGGGMDASLSLGGRNPLHAMHSALVAETAEDFATANLENDFLVATRVAGAGLNEFLSKSIGLGIACVHPVEISGKNCRFGAAGSGTNFNDGITVIIGLRREECQHHRLFQLWNLHVYFLDFSPCQFGHFGIIASGEFLVLDQLLASALQRIPGCEKLFDARVFTQDFPCLLCVIEKRGVGDGRFQLGKTHTAVGDEWGKIEIHGGSSLKCPSGSRHTIGTPREMPLVRSLPDTGREGVS